MQPRSLSEESSNPLAAVGIETIPDEEDFASEVAQEIA